MGTPVFVYGTLKAGERNHHLMKAAHFVGPTSTGKACFSMAEYDSSSHPGRSTPAVCEGGAFRVGGELYEVEDDLLAQLDEFEQVGEHYVRKTVVLEEGRLAQMYLLLPSSSKQPREFVRFVRQNDKITTWSEAQNR